MLQQFLLVWLLGISALALLWPSLAGTAAPDPFTASKPLLPTLFALTMLAIGWGLPRKELAEIPRRWYQVVGGVGIQFLSMPLLAYAVTRLWQLPDALAMGVLLVGTVPGAMASNVLTANARGNTSYSVCLTSVATLLSPWVTPLVLAVLVAARFDVDAGKLRSQLLLTVVVPVIAGQILQRAIPRSARLAERWGPVLANWAILWIIAVAVGLNRGNLSQASWEIALPLLVLNAAGYLAGYLGGVGMRLAEGQRRALTLEVGMQNAGLGVTLAIANYADVAEVALAPALYTFGCMFTGTLLAQVWRWFPNADSVADLPAKPRDGLSNR